MDATRRWLAGGSFFEPYQLAGPVPHPDGRRPVRAQRPAAVRRVHGPAGDPVVGDPAGRHRVGDLALHPAPVAWPFIALCIFWPPMVARTVAGNPVMWVMACRRARLHLRWAFVGVLLKPSLFPFALLGVRSRSWWIALALWIVICLPFGGLWFDWVSAVTNSTEGGLLYSLQDVPILLLPVIAGTDALADRCRPGDGPQARIRNSISVDRRSAK